MKKVELNIWMNAALLLLLDQASKWLAGTYLQKPLSLLPGISLEYAQNYGIAWSIPIPYTLLLILNIVLLVALPYYLWRNLDLRKKTAIIALVLIMGGAVSNLFDRLVHGYVVDFISLWIWPVFNLADAFLTIGIFLTVLFYGKIKRIS